MNDEAVEELRILTTCRCDPAWTERRLHGPGCLEEYRVEVDALAADQDHWKARAETAEGERDAMQRNWFDAQDAWEQLLPLVQAARAWRESVTETARGTVTPEQIAVALTERKLIAAVDALPGDETSP